MPIYRVVDWKNKYENSRTLHLKRMEWVPIPNKMDGDGYTELLDHPNGPAHFGCWVAIVEIASKCELRGTLQRAGAQPHTAATLARVSRFPIAIMAEALPRLIAIGWLEDVLSSEQIDEHEATLMQSVALTKPQDALSKPQMDLIKPQDPYGTERNGTERNGTEGAPVLEFPTEDSAMRKLAKVFHHGGKPTSEKDWQRATVAAISADVSDEEILEKVIPYVHDELAAMGDPRKFTGPENLFTRKPFPWRAWEPPKRKTQSDLMLESLAAAREGEVWEAEDEAH